MITASSFRSSDRLGEYGRRNRQALRMAIWLLVAFGAICLSIHLGRWGDKPPEGAAQIVAMAVSWVFGNGDLPNEPLWHQVLAKIAAPFLLPLLGVLAFVDSLRQRSLLVLRRAWPGRLSRPLVVVIGLGDKGLEIVQTELRDSNHCVVIEQDADSPRVNEARSLGATVWIGDGESARDIVTACWKRPTRVWVTTRSTERNLRILDQVNRKLGGYRSRAGMPRLDVHVRVNSSADLLDGMSLSLLNQDKPNYLTHLTSLEESAAQWLIHCHPVRVDGEGRAPRVLIIGAGAFGRAVFKELLLLCHFPETDLGVLARAQSASEAELSAGRVPQLVVVDRDPEAIASLMSEFPFLEARHIEGVTPCIAHRTIKGQDARNWSFEDYRDSVRGRQPFSHVFVAMGSEVANLAVAERIWAWERQIDSRFQTSIVPVVYDVQAVRWNRIRQGVHNAEASEVGGPGALPPVRPFCLQDARSARAFRWQRGLERMAARIHILYDDKVPWHVLAEEKRRSNLAQARAVWNWYRLGKAWANVPPIPAESDSKFECEFECEHRRWNAYVLASGFSAGLGGSDWGDKIAVEGSSKTSVKLRDLARANPSIASYGKLGLPIQEFDKKFVKSRSEVMKAFDSTQA